ncbi:MAG TPA: hypothetical protein VNJ70_06375 [Thermoanaerobaculia bacterium]|nr:hypothetical protein [Thermoanaerobaculia bacterium]
MHHVVRVAPIGVWAIAFNSPSVFAGQTGGAFVDGNDGLTAEQLAQIMPSIHDL